MIYVHFITFTWKTHLHYCWLGRVSILVGLGRGGLNILGLLWHFYANENKMTLLFISDVTRQHLNYVHDVIIERLFVYLVLNLKHALCKYNTMVCCHQQEFMDYVIIIIATVFIV